MPLRLVLFYCHHFLGVQDEHWHQYTDCAWQLYCAGCAGCYRVAIQGYPLVSMVESRIGSYVRGGDGGIWKSLGSLLVAAIGGGGFG